MLVQRRRRWANISAALDQRLVFAGMVASITALYREYEFTTRIVNIFHSCHHVIAWFFPGDCEVCRRVDVALYDLMVTPQSNWFVGNRPSPILVYIQCNDTYFIMHDILTAQFFLLKGLTQAKIIKKSVILFCLLNMTIWCKHVHRLELQNCFNFSAAHSPVRLDIETKFPYFLFLTWLSIIRNLEFRLYI